MVAKNTLWDRTPVMLKLLFLVLGGAFSTGMAYGVLAYKVDASEARITETVDRVAVMVTDIAVIRDRQLAVINKAESIDAKLDRLLEEKN